MFFRFTKSETKEITSSIISRTLNSLKSKKLAPLSFGGVSEEKSTESEASKKIFNFKII